jgi:hypothetical protein
MANYTNEDVVADMVGVGKQTPPKRKKTMTETDHDLHNISVQISDTLWRAMQLKVAFGQNGERTLSAVIRNALDRYCAAEIEIIEKRQK